MRKDWAGIILLAVFILCQILDGVFTYLGVEVYKIAREGNPIITALMFKLGPAIGLIVPKIFASVIGIVFFNTNNHVMLALSTGFYIKLVYDWFDKLYLS